MPVPAPTPRPTLDPSVNFAGIVALQALARNIRTMAASGTLDVGYPVTKIDVEEPTIPEPVVYRTCISQDADGTCTYLCAAGYYDPQCSSMCECDPIGATECLDGAEGSGALLLDDGCAIVRRELKFLPVSVT